MFELDLTAELDRQFTVCNACRYCEGFCAVFGAAELRTAFGERDLAYLSNLCHDCKMCYDACMFSPPHEFNVNVPAILAEGRAQTYERYGFPRVFARLFRTPLTAASVFTLAGIVVTLLAVVASAGVAALWTQQLGSGAFYRVVPYSALVVPAIALALYGVAILAIGAVDYAADIGPGFAFLSPASVGRALHDALTLVYLKGGGSGCYDVHRGSQLRRVFHMLVFWGFLCDFAATTVAAIAQGFFGRLPPYPLLSVPVILGTIGGIGIVVGAAGLIAIKRASDPQPASGRMIAMDYAFLATLELVALTGLALLAFRSTNMMGTLLGVHLGALVGFFVTAPYSKFVHFVYRSLALVKNAHEQRDVSHQPP